MPKLTTEEWAVWVQALEGAEQDVRRAYERRAQIFYLAREAGFTEADMALVTGLTKTRHGQIIRKYRERF